MLKHYELQSKILMNDIPYQEEWQKPSQADVRYTEEVRNAFKDQLSRRIRH